MSINFGTTAEPRGLHLFTLFRIPVYVEGGFVFLMAFYFLSAADGSAINVSEIGLWCFIVALSLLVHEFGHALTSKWLGCDMIRIALTFGGYATHSPTTPGRSIVIGLAGPAFGLMLGIAALIAWRFGDPLFAIGPEGAMVYVIGNLMFVNFFWTLFNLLPIYPLDGGQVMLNALYFGTTPDRAAAWTSRVSVVFCILVGALAYKTGFVFITLLCAFCLVQNLRSSGAFR